MRVVIFFTTILMGFAIAGCKKNFEGTLPFQPPVADFTIAEEVGDTISDTDTALTYNLVRFKPGYQYDSVLWDIDNGGMMKKIDILKVRFFNTGLYQVKMTGYRYQYPSPGIIKDSITKSVYIVDREGGAGYLSTFRGSVTGNENDSFNISIYRILQNLPAYPENTHVLDNLPKGCRSILPGVPSAPLTTLYFGYRMFVTDAPRCFPATICIATLKSRRLTVDYSIIDSTKPFNPVTGSYTMISKRFTGYRL
jgi:hypothetical protein